MAEQANERIHIDASPERCREVALDFESYPTWAKDLKHVEVLERDAEGRAVQVEFRAAGLGKSTRYVLEYDYSALPDSFSWHLVDSDMLRQLDGTYRFEADGTGTRVHYDLTVDLKIPLPGLIKRRGAGMIMGNALKGLKQAVERP